jgi:hypothetical protein
MKGADPAHQRWVAMAKKAGLLVNPENFMPSIHAAAEKGASPLRVIRGGDGAYNLGAPIGNVR